MEALERSQKTALILSILFFEFLMDGCMKEKKFSVRIFVSLKVTIIFLQSIVFRRNPRLD